MYKKGQVTIFVIIAIVLVVLGVLVYSFRDVVTTDSVPEEVEPVKVRFMECVEDSVEKGVSILKSNAGYIENPDFEPGSRYQPFSSSLSFSGNEVPYWYYLSGSGVVREQVPTVQEMESQLSEFVAEEVVSCDFYDLEDEGFVVNLREGDVDVRVNSDYIDVDLATGISVEVRQENFVLNEHNFRYETYLGTLHEEAIDFYEKNNLEFLLVEYGIDALRLNLPVDGVELTCSPLSWNVDNLFLDLQEAFELNYMALGNSNENNDYFNLDFSGDVDLDFVYSSDWPTYFEVNPADGNVLISEPVGNQQGMGILGFCYVPYHYVYDVRYPLMVRVSKSSEVFQFPLVLEINKNVRGEPEVSSFDSLPETEICEFANTEMSVSVYNSDLEPVEGDVTYDCFDSKCNLGETENGKLDALFPQCVNGVLNVRAEGYKDTSVVYSTVESSQMVVVLDNEYEREVILGLDEGRYSGNAVVTFSSEDYTTSAVLPDDNNVVLSPGEYDVSVMAYSDSSITFPETEREECYTVPRSGLLGMAGLTEEECNTVTVPSQELSSALIGGGSIRYNFDDESLRDSEAIVIEAQRLKTPETLEELQENYVIIEGNQLGVSLR